MNRTTLTEQIVETRIRKGITWADVARELGASKEWVTAACLDQMTFSKDQAERIVSIFELPVEAVTVLQTPPTRGLDATAVAGDPVIHRLREIVAVYGPAIKELIHEEFGDGIMSAIDFRLRLDRRADPRGDRVELVLSGKYLPYPTA
ncbi:cyanate lyase [Streptomyces sp. LBL]|uniref:cyanase n=1 Tax=Streptomyces sp. LBL TaxID=2940562 RepID=UPI0024763E51|nr:cyanase [Streptomyces sp. LBL]MDH6630181.1 cyanate lyase [Streptomyces sp. LBL]